MAAASLLLGIGLSGLMGATYLTVGLLVLRRARENEERGVFRAFALWWTGLAATTFLGVVRDLLAVAGLASEAVVETTIHLGLLPLVLALWGLFYYLGYIFLGRRRLLVPSIVLYALIHVLFVYIVVSLDPTGVILRTWDVQIAYAHELTAALNLGLVVLLVLPILLGVFAYASLMFRIRAPEQRFRIGMVSLAFFIWFGGVFLASLVGLSRIEWWSLASRLLALASSLLVALAYAPPRRVRRRLAGERPPLAEGAMTEGRDG